jgi:hypothetical protein
VIGVIVVDSRHCSTAGHFSLEALPCGVAEVPNPRPTSALHRLPARIA